jgi:hypothetical protein
MMLILTTEFRASHKVAYYLGPLSDFPNRWASAFDPRRSAQEQRQILKEGYTRPVCCKDPNCCRKVATIYQTLEELVACEEFKSIWRSRGAKGKNTNMHVERILGLVKKSCPAKLPFAERLLASGLLSEWLKTHTKDGSNDPRITTRKQLIESGVPLVCAKVESSRGGLHPKMIYSNTKLAEDTDARIKANLPKRSRTESNDRKRILNEEFDTLDPADRAPFENEAAKRKHDRRESIGDPANNVDAYPASKRFNMGNKQEPLQEAMLNTIYMDNAGSENCGGYSRTCEKLRREFVNYSVIGDKGDIPATLKVKYFSNCPSLHRGICRWDDRINFPLALELGTRLNQYCLNTDSIAEGDWLTTTSRHLDKTVASVSFYVAHQRFSDPKIALLTLADSQTDEDGELTFSLRATDRLEQSTPWAVAKLLLGGLASGVDVRVELFEVGNFSYKRNTTEHLMIVKVQMERVRSSVNLFEWVHSTTKTAADKKAATRAKPAKSDNIFEKGFQDLNVKPARSRGHNAAGGGMQHLLDPAVLASIKAASKKDDVALLAELQVEHDDVITSSDNESNDSKVGEMDADAIIEMLKTAADLSVPAPTPKPTPKPHGAPPPIPMPPPAKPKLDAKTTQRR